MGLTIDDVRAYGDSIDRIERKALEMLTDGLGKLDSSDISAYIDAAVALTNAMCGSSAMAAAELAAAYYDTVREIQVGSKLGAEAIDLHVPEATESVIRSVQVDGNLLAASDVRSRCGDRLSYEVKRAAGETVRRNAAKDPAKPRYARVPSGIDTCKFCLMLASKKSEDGSGAYWSAKSAGKWDHYHPNCRCRVIPMFKGGVDGFDPDRYYDMWKHPERFPDLIAARKAKRREKYERERIRKRINESTVIADSLYSGGANQVWKMYEDADKAIKKAWNSGTKHNRDEYLMHIKSMITVGDISIEGMPYLEGKELMVGKWLSAAGRNVLFRDANIHKDADGVTSDLLVDGEMWEMKCIRSGSYKKAVRRVVEKLDRQGPNFIIDMSPSNLCGEQLLVRFAKLLDDERIGKIILITGGKMHLLTR